MTLEELNSQFVNVMSRIGETFCRIESDKKLLTELKKRKQEIEMAARQIQTQPQIPLTGTVDEAQPND